MKTFNGTSFHELTPKPMMLMLEKLRLNRTRVRFHWGNIETGLDWGDEFDVKGRVSRSMGSSQIPILVYNSRSYGGVAILTHCIVKITATKGGAVIYQHPKYHKQNENH